MIIKEKLLVPILFLALTFSINYSSAQTKFAIIGDYGDNNNDEAAVAVIC